MIPPDESLARLERNLGWLLICGVGLSATLLALGLALLGVSPDGSASGHLLAAGLVILMATPVLRVVVSMVEYILLREWSFVMTTMVVLIELGVGVAYALVRR